MLHILWVVIKFILIVLGVLLGLLLLAVLLLLFCPLRYRASACKKGDDWKLVSADAGVSWLFGGISLKVWMVQGMMHNRIRILGIPLDKLFKRKKSAGEKRKAGNARGRKHENSGEDPQKSDKEALAQERKTPLAVQKQEEPVPAAVSEEKAVSPYKDKPHGQSSGKQGTGGLFSRFLEKLKQIAAVPVRIFKILAGIPGLIIQKIRNIALTFRRFYDRMDWWKQFVSHPRTQAAISLVWKYAKGLVKHVLPTKIRGTLTFGSEDPAVMGTVLALLGMSMPFHKNCIAVCPVFDGVNILEGNVRLKGRIYGWMLLKAAVTIYFNKNVKYVISRWKHKEG